jgi:hypothetical protein
VDSGFQYCFHGGEEKGQVWPQIVFPCKGFGDLGSLTDVRLCGWLLENNRN